MNRAINVKIAPFDRPALAVCRAAREGSRQGRFRTGMTVYGGGYFNYYSRVAEGYWERRSFLGAWRRLYAADRRWTPPFHPLLFRLLVRGQSEHLRRMNPALVYLEALPGRRRGDGTQGQFTASMEEPVAAAVILADPRRRDRAAYLALLHCANDEESLERLISLASEQAWARGRSGLLGPVGLSPHLGSGVLLDHFHRNPPLHTAYNPPYLPELIENALEPGRQTRLYGVECSAPAPGDCTPAGVMLAPLEPARLAADLLPLLQAACEATDDLPPPDAAEAAFLLEWLRAFPLFGWAALADGKTVGFVLLQADLGAALRRARGGRNPFWRGWLAWRAGRARSASAPAGRLLFGAVLPEYRRRGIGRALWHAALTAAHGAGWREMTAGPVTSTSAGAAFLVAMGAQPRQRYRLYGTDEG